MWKIANQKSRAGFKPVRGGRKKDLVKLAKEHGYGADEVESRNDRGTWYFIVPEGLAKKIVHERPKLTKPYMGL